MNTSLIRPAFLNQYTGSFDPYDLWMTSPGIYARDHFYQGHLRGKVLSAAIALADWVFPRSSRRVLMVGRRVYPITLAQWIGMSRIDRPEDARRFVQELERCAACNTPDSVSWGLGFPWMSKNGLYGPETPFVTHTPYVMEALLHLGRIGGEEGERALSLFDRTLPFLDSLKVMQESGEVLALSYAPVEEPRIVVNANSYAAFALALHLKRKREKSGGSDDIADLEDRVCRLVRWVVSQQNEDGSWYYYADTDPGNFIDCFHSCFVLKNLGKVAREVPETTEISREALVKGSRFVREAFFDPAARLARRFTLRDIKDPFVWDLYDQAEYLGMLIDESDYESAVQLTRCVRDRFMSGGQFYCKIDIFGRRWGKNFYRWGIMPFLYQESRLYAAIGKEAEN